jgi:hypothetical protein
LKTFQKAYENNKYKKGEIMSTKVCIACGMPMSKPSDFASGDEMKDYCVYCARPDGAMQSYPEKLEGTIHFLIKTQGLDENAAHSAAVTILAKLPAWKNINENI